MNVVAEYKQKSIEELVAKGVGLRDIARRLLVDRSTVRRVARKLSKPPTPSTGSEDENGVKPPTPSTGTESEAAQNHPPCRPALVSGPIASKLSVSECAPHRDWIEAQVDFAFVPV